MKAYNMLDERMDKFAKLPPLMGKRAAPDAAPAFRSLYRRHNGDELELSDMTVAGM